MQSLVGGTGDQQLARLPDILVVGFDDRHVEFLPQARNDLFDAAALGFEGMALGQVDR